MTKLIRHGFDTVELAYRAAIPEKFLTALKDAKSRALETRKPTPITWNGVSVLVEATGGQGGYTYRIDTGRIGAIWKFRDVGSRDPWSAHVKVKAHMLAVHGLPTSKEIADNFLLSVGARFDPNDARVGRADLAFDFYDEDVELVPEHFVSHAKSTKSEHIERTLKGVRTNYVRIGKLPGKQVCVYDKAGLVNGSNDLIWTELLTCAARSHNIEFGDTITNVWRVELRAGKTQLDRYLKPSRRWDLFQANVEPVFRDILESMTWRVPEHDTNRSRWRAHPIWSELDSALMFSLCSCYRASSLSAKTLEFLQEEYRETLIAQTDGLILTQAALNGATSDSIKSFCRRSYNATARRLSARSNLSAELSERQRRFQLMFSANGGSDV